MVWKIRTGTGMNIVWIFVLIVFSTLLKDHSFLIGLQGHQRRCKTRVLAALSPRRRRGRSNNSCRSSSSSCRSSSSSCRSSSSSCRISSSSCRSSSSSCRSSSSSCRSSCSYISGKRNSGSFSCSCNCSSCRNAAVLLLLLASSNLFPSCYFVIFL